METIEQVGIMLTSVITMTNLLLMIIALILHRIWKLMQKARVEISFYDTHMSGGSHETNHKISLEGLNRYSEEVKKKEKRY